MEKTIATLEATPVACTGCGAVVAEFNQAGFGGLLTDHNIACDWHSRESRCKHEGPCYVEAPNLENGGSE